MKYGLNEFDLQQQASNRQSTSTCWKVHSLRRRRRLKGKRTDVEDQQALVMGLGTRDCVAGCGWGASSDEEEVVVLNLEDRELREKTLEVECAAALKR